ncbi:MAG: MFS transporter [Anaerorhabdus sp.]
MSKKEKLICIISGLWILASTMSSSFVSVYLYSYTGSLVVMTIFTMIRIFMFTIFFIIGAKLAQKFGYSITMFTGIILSSLYLLLVLYGNSLFENYNWSVYLVGAFIGIGEGFYWISSTSLRQLVSIPETRMRFINMIGLFDNSAKLFAPMIASFLIAISINDIEGYKEIFKVILATYVVIAVLATQIKENAEAKKFVILKHLYSNLKNDPQWRYCATTTILFGIRDSLLLTLTGLLIFEALGTNGTLYSNLLIFFSFITVVAHMFLAKRVQRPFNMKIFFVSSIALTLSTIVLAYFPNMFGAVFFGVVNGASLPLVSNTYQKDYMEIISQYRTSENMIGRIISRDIFFTVGRMIGMSAIVLAFYIFPNDTYILYSVSLVSLSSIVVAFVIYNYRKKTS